MVFVCPVVEPPELVHLSYAVEKPKVEVLSDLAEETDSKLKLEGGTESRSSLKKLSAGKTKPEAEVKQEVKQPDVSKQESSKEKKDVERPPIFVTLQ